MITNIKSHGYHPANWNSRKISAFIRGFCLINIILFSYRIGEIAFNYSNSDSLPTVGINYNATPERLERKTTLAEYQFTILHRNIFGSSTDLIDINEVNTLPLRLVGVHYNLKDAKKRFTILEDKRTGKQDVFEVNDLAFKVAEVVEIGVHHVDVVNNNVKYRLYLSGKASDVEKKIEKIEKELIVDITHKKRREGIRETSFRNYEIDRKLAEEVLGDLQYHLNTGRSKIHEEGILVYGFGPDSIFKEIGIDDSDIITKVNGMPLTDFVGVTELFTAFTVDGLDKLDMVVITVKRAGQEIPIHYKLKK